MIVVRNTSEGIKKGLDDGRICGVAHCSKGSTTDLYQVQLILPFKLLCFSVLPSALREDRRQSTSLACKEYNKSASS